MFMKVKQVIVVRKDLKMRKGKLAAQAAHASMGAILKFRENSNDDVVLLRPSEEALRWLNSSFTKICAGIDSEEELLALVESANSVGLLNCLIVDNGLTEFNGVPTRTCAAFGPAASEEIDKITGKLALL